MEMDGYLLLQLVEDELHDDIIVEAEDLRDALRDPRLDDLQVYFGHVHLKFHSSRKQNRISSFRAKT